LINQRRLSQIHPFEIASLSSCLNSSYPFLLASLGQPGHGAQCDFGHNSYWLRFVNVIEQVVMVWVIGAWVVGDSGTMIDWVFHHSCNTAQ
jgi:hypothetical protein